MAAVPPSPPTAPSPPASSLPVSPGAQSPGAMWGRAAVGRLWGRGMAARETQAFREGTQASGGTQEFGKGTQGSGRPLAGKVALVTAATAGIGLAVSRALGVAGASVVLSSRRAPHVEAAVGQLRGEGLEVSGVVCHVGQPHSREVLVQKALDTYGGIDILVSNAAVNPALGPTLDADESVWEKALGPYSVSKAALLGLVKVLANELRPRGIRVNGVAPGLVRTHFSAALWEDEPTLQRVMAAMGIDRLGTPEDVAKVVTFLCSPDAAYVVGETLVVAGGAPSHL
ncbi:dehydrogenase/reductase SDR family member 4 isoform X2 [Columba livia]|uniref:dehydrogenase/reductase SDR family member 4 isoform X2 n=1 Tax=Columba livia TaxID=8932 RepID=UPI0031BA1CE5